MKHKTQVLEDHFDNSADDARSIEWQKHAKHRPCAMRRVYTHPITGHRFIKKGDPIVSQWEGDNFNLKKITKGKAFKLVKKFANPLNSLKLLKEATAFSILMPVVPLMRRALKKKGLHPPGKISSLAQMFFENVVKKHTSHYDDVDSENLEDNLLPLAIVPPILSFVKGVIQKGKDNKAKVAAGQKPEPLNPAVAEMAQDGIAVEQNLVAKAKEAGVPVDGNGAPLTQSSSAPSNDTAPPSDGSDKILGMPKMAVIVGGIIIAVIIGFMVFKK